MLAGENLVKKKGSPRTPLLKFLVCHDLGKR